MAVRPNGRYDTVKTDVEKEPKVSAPKFTATDVYNRFRDLGLYETIDKRDFALININPQYGMDLLNAKLEYNDPVTSEERKAEIASDFETRRTNEYASRKVGPKVAGNGIFTANGGNNNWQSLLESMLASYASDKFSYDANSDPRYALAKEYAVNAMKNQMAESSTLSGGYGNSYASAAGQGVYTEYMDNAAASLEADAYNRWQNEKADKLNMISMVSALEERDYNRAYQKERDAKADARYDKEMAIAAEDRAWNRALVSAEYGDFSSLGALGVNTADAEKIFKSEADYKLFMTGLDKYSATGNVEYLEGLGLSEESIGGIVARYNAAQYAEAFAQAYQRYQVTHNPAEFDGLGVDTSYLEKIDDDAEYARQLEQAMLIANMGDFSELEKLHIDTTRLERQWQLALTPSYSGGGKSGSTTSGNPFDIDSIFIELDRAGAYESPVSVYDIIMSSGNYTQGEAKSIAERYALYNNGIATFMGRIEEIYNSGGSDYEVFEYIDSLLSAGADEQSVAGLLARLGIADAYAAYHSNR